MRILCNIIWLVFGGIAIAIYYMVASLILMLTLIGIPFGLQTFKLGVFALWPFGKEVITHPTSGCLTLGMNILWLLTGGLKICILHCFLGCAFCLTIIGIPFGKQHFKLAEIALTPFGREIAPQDS